MGEADQSLQTFIGAGHTAQEAGLIEERIGIIIHKLKFIPDTQRIKVAYIKDIAPWQFSSDNYVEQAIRLAGGIPQIDPTLPDFSPEVLVILSNQPVGQLLGQLPDMLSGDFWPETSAVKNNQVFLVHHPEYLRTPSLHPADDVEILAEIINPGYFVFGRDEDAWINFAISTS